jgi:recombination protein RecR
MDGLTQLAELLREFPGIGPRQARRLAFYLVRRDRNWVDSFAKTLLTAKSEVRTCTSCMRLFPATGDAVDCNICTNPSRDTAMLLLVEKDVDLENIERTGAYSGLYFVVGGTTSALDKDPARSIRLRELEQRIKNSDLREVVLALSATTEGDETATFLRDHIETKVDTKTVTITHLGRGLSTGTELEYVDKDTMRNALSGRN